MPGDTLTWVIACGGWIVAIFSIWVGYRERTTAREEERLHQTLEYFTGGTQKRSVGVALVEGVWSGHPQHMRVLIPVLANQIVYLLLTTKSENEAHEERNLIRMLDLFSNSPFASLADNAYRFNVLDAITRKLEGESGGLHLSEATLKRWYEKLSET